MADISKIKLADGTSLNIKDATGRANVTTLLGGHNLEALGAAAWQSVAAAIDGDGLVSAAITKAYVDAQIGTIHKFDVVVADELPEASADTMYKLYLIPKAGSATGNAKEEWITIRNGVEGSYTYAWEKIGDTEIDLSGYVQKTQKIAGIDLQDDITTAELQGALGLEDLAYADTASGETTLNTIDTITMKTLTVAGNATVTTSTDDAVIAEKSAYTPAGNITGSAISGGSITVELDSTSTGATVNTTSYTPEGSVSITQDAAGTFQVGGTNASSAVTFTGGSTANVLSSVKTAAVLPSFTEGTFTEAAIQDGFYTAGSAATWTGATYTAPSLGDASTSNFAESGLNAEVGTGTDAETLIFTAANTSAAVTDRGSFSAGNVNFGSFNGGSATVIDTTKFFGGSKAADTWDAGSAAEFDTTDVVDNIGTGTAAAQSFTGNKYIPSFSGTEKANAIVTSVSYDKASVKTAAFNPTAATLGFSGTEVTNLIPSKITYAKADATAAYSASVLPEVNAYNRTAKTISITVNPD